MDYYLISEASPFICREDAAFGQLNPREWPAPDQVAQLRCPYDTTGLVAGVTPSGNLYARADVADAIKQVCGEHARLVRAVLDDDPGYRIVYFVAHYDCVDSSDPERSALDAGRMGPSPIFRLAKTTKLLFARQDVAELLHHAGARNLGYKLQGLKKDGQWITRPPEPPPAPPKRAPRPVPYKEMFAVIRNMHDPRQAFEQLRELGSDVPVIDDIHAPDIEADVESAGVWLAQWLLGSQPKGVCLVLDTLNEKEGRGANVAIGTSDQANPSDVADDRWMHECSNYRDHLIRGVYEMHRVYEESAPFEDQLLLEYLFFLGYSGVVLLAAIDKLDPKWDCIIKWGFHDDDIFPLARSSSTGLERIVPRAWPE